MPNVKKYYRSTIFWTNFFRV